MTLEPTCREVFDLVVVEPGTWHFLTAQVKTIYQRADRDGALVIYAKKGDGSAYSRKDADLIIGVHGQDVYLIENNEQGEYWATPKSAAVRWRLLTAGGVAESQNENKPEGVSA